MLEAIYYHADSTLKRVPGKRPAPPYDLQQNFSGLKARCLPWSFLGTKYDIPDLA